MAKFGEGDKRWIVEDRPDGTNVHNWHWAETDCIEYSRTFFTTALTNIPILTGEGGLFIKTKKLDKLEGEAYVNIRKGKIIPGYEIQLVLSWEGEAKDDQGNTLLKSSGLVELPYIADENVGEVPEMRVSFEGEGEIGKRIKEAFVVKGKEVVLGKVREFEEAMARGGPCRDELDAKQVAPKAAVKAGKGEGESAAAATAVTKKEVKVKKEEEKERRGYRTIKLSERFRCRAQDLYEIMMDDNRWKGFTQSNARISKEVGGEFSIFDGSVTGTHVDLQVGKLIVQKWRFGNWPDGVFSTVKLTFEEPESGVTVVKLVQTDVPEEDRYGNETVVENTERGWRDLIFQRIRAIFGFGF